MSQARRIREIVTERQAQDALWGGPSSDDKHSTDRWLTIIMRHLGLAANDSTEFDTGRYRKQLVRVAATAVAALEALDRQTRRQDVADHLDHEREKL